MRTRFAGGQAWNVVTRLAEVKAPDSLGTYSAQEGDLASPGFPSHPTNQIFSELTYESMNPLHAVFAQLLTTMPGRFVERCSSDEPATLRDLHRPHRKNAVPNKAGTQMPAIRPIQPIRATAAICHAPNASPFANTTVRVDLPVAAHKANRTPRWTSSSPNAVPTATLSNVMGALMPSWEPPRTAVRIAEPPTTNKSRRVGRRRVFRARLEGITSPRSLRRHPTTRRAADPSAPTKGGAAVVNSSPALPPTRRWSITTTFPATTKQAVMAAAKATGTRGDGPFLIDVASSLIVRHQASRTSLGFTTRSPAYVNVPAGLNKQMCLRVRHGGHKKPTHGHGGCV